MRNSRARTTRLVLGSCAVALSCICTLTISSKAAAAVYKCTDASGNVSYNQIPCGDENKAQTVLSTSTQKKAAIDCRIANNFANHIAARMRLGESSGNVFDSYGGIDAIPTTSIGIISYVYSHKENIDTGPQRITALSAARCSTNAYGPVSCESFPHNYIADRGGCEHAATNANTDLLTSKPNHQTTHAIPEGSTQGLGVRTAQSELDSSSNCQQDVRSQLGELVEQMRTEQSAHIQSAHKQPAHKQSANQQDELENRKQQLYAQLSGC